MIRTNILHLRRMDWWFWCKPLDVLGSCSNLDTSLSFTFLFKFTMNFEYGLVFQSFHSIFEKTYNSENTNCSWSVIGMMRNFARNG